jgi:hypothetical protein
VAGYRYARGIEIIGCQGHRAKTALAFGSLVHYIVVAEDDIAGRDAYSAVLQRWLILRGEEANDPATGSHPAGIDLRQLFVEALHPELIQIDLRQLGVEFTPRSGIKLDICSPNSRLIRERVRKGENFAPKHFNSPYLS